MEKHTSHQRIILYFQYIPMTGWLKTHSENPVIIKDMKKYLWNPENMKDLYDTLTALPKEEFFDLHPEELRQVNILYSEMRRDPNKHDSDISWHLSNLIRLKLNIENSIGNLVNIIEIIPTEKYFMGENWENEKQIIFVHKIKKIFSNLVSQLYIHKKQITPDEVEYINEKIFEKIKKQEEIHTSKLVELLSFFLQKQIYTGTDEVDTAIRELIEIHGRDINSILLWENNVLETEYVRLSLVFMKYGLGKIDIDGFVKDIDKIINQNNEEIQRLIKPFIPLYGRLRSVLEETKIEEEKSQDIIPFQGPKDLKDIGKIDVEEIEKHAQKNKHLRILKNCDKTILEQKLQILRDICDLSNSGQKMIEE